MMLHGRISKVVDALAGRLARICSMQPPFPVTAVPDHEQLNRRLRKTLMTMSRTIPDVVSNRETGPSYFDNKWLSKNDLFKSDDPDIQTLMQHVEAYVNKRFAAATQERRLFITSMWCIVGQTGLTGRCHVYRGKVSGAYYVDSGRAEDPDSGLLQFFPRLGKAMWPARHYWNTGVADYRNGVPTLAPQSGMLVLFPGDLLHSVRRYAGKRERIVVSFNLE